MLAYTHKAIRACNYGQLPVMDSSVPQDSDRYLCSTCGKSFARPEHLRRHERTHSEARRYHCRRCRKGFDRKDVYRRHEARHLVPEDDFLPKMTRACVGCASAKARCSRTRPCRRCAGRGQECLYLDRESDDAQQPPSVGLLRDDTCITGVGLEPAAVGAATFTSADLNDPQVPWTTGVVDDVNWLPTDISPIAYEDNLTTTSAIPFDFSVILEGSWGELERQQPKGNGLPTLYGGTFDSLDGSMHPYFTPFFMPEFAEPVTDASPSSISMDNVENIKGPLLNYARFTFQPEIEEKRFCLRYTAQAGDSPPQILHVDAYGRIVQAYFQLCQGSGLFPPFADSPPPEKSVLEECLSLYQARLHPGFPVIHFPTDLSAESPWTLILAICAAGSQLLEGADAALFSISMQEFLRRVMIAEEERAVHGPSMELIEAKTRLLHAIGAGYLGHKLLFKSAIRSMSDLVAFCRSRWTAKAFEALDMVSAETVEERWAIWRYREQKLRVGYGIWLVDATWSFHHYRPPALTLEDTSELPLPCHESLWEAQSAAEWHRLSESSGSSGTFLESIQHLYVNQLPLKGMGSFSTAILAQGICHQTWGVQKQVRQGLSRFEPSAIRQPNAEVHVQLSIWPPSVPLFNKWRNAACGCLDLLRRSLAEDLSTQQNDLALLHLHQASMVLLAPLQNIVRFASYLAGNSRGTPLAANSADAREDRRLIQSWAKQDHFKARTAATHAGAIFWGVRKLNSNSFHEPPALALASLVLWAFSIFSTSIDSRKSSRGHSGTNRNSRSSQERGGSSSSESSSGENRNAVILNSSPDSELIEQFIRDGGGKFDAFIIGVGSIKELKAPEKILALARKFLQSMNSWKGCSYGWIYLIDNLTRVTKKIRKRNGDLQRHSLIKHATDDTTMEHVGV